MIINTEKLLKAEVYDFDSGAEASEKKGMGGGSCVVRDIGMFTLPCPGHPQYGEMKEEIKNIRRRKAKLEKEIKGLGIVSDSVKGTRSDGPMAV